LDRSTAAIRGGTVNNWCDSSGIAVTCLICASLGFATLGQINRRRPWRHFRKSPPAQAAGFLLGI